MEDLLEDMPLSITPYEDIAACAMAMDCISDMDDDTRILKRNGGDTLEDRLSLDG